ncbi:protein D1-like [Clytia hemisphaerica]|uniref:Phosphatidylethanolamine binding protein n=1 Tax=Clytia hemisphaerica TaxID=252671 RepID=A0A7M5V069_9CNID|eukprot:TCONS_00069422-protein
MMNLKLAQNINMRFSTFCCSLLFVFAINFDLDSFVKAHDEDSDGIEEDEHLVHIGNIDKDSCTVDKEMEVTFAGVTVVCGENYFLAGFNKKPKVVLNRANINIYYTLVMLDPDAPSRKDPSQRSWLHWLIVNIHNADISTGFEVVEYNPPTPPKNSGFHRYVFLLIVQPKKEKEYLPIVKRGKFNINKYATNHSLTNLAGLTYFQTKKEDKLQLPANAD